MNWGIRKVLWINLICETSFGENPETRSLIMLGRRLLFLWYVIWLSAVSLSPLGRAHSCSGSCHWLFPHSSTRTFLPSVRSTPTNGSSDWVYIFALKVFPEYHSIPPAPPGRTPTFATAQEKFPTPAERERTPRYLTIQTERVFEQIRKDTLTKVKRCANSTGCSTFTFLMTT